MPMPDDTPARLVAAATQLIAEGGEDATSLRAVSRAARSNAAAVHYHFGGRDELLAAVVESLLEPVQRRRLELLDSLRGSAPVAAVVEALVRPDLELLAELRPDRVRVARLLGQPPEPGTAVAALLERQFEALAARAIPLLDVAASGDELRRRLRWVRAVAASVLATAPSEGDGAPSDEDDEDTVDARVARVVGFCAAGLSAPPARSPAARGQATRAQARGGAGPAKAGKAKKRKKAVDTRS